MVVGTQGMEIDTFTKHGGGEKDGAKDSNFRQAQTPKHCNKGNRVQGPGVPGFQPQAYPGYNQGQHSFRPPGLYNPNTRAPNGAPPPYYGQPSSVMVSPGGGSYMRPPSNYYHGGGGEYEQHQHPGYGQYQNHRYPHPMYGSEMHNRPPTYEPPRSQQQTTLPPQNGMDFSRAVSSSFGESNSKSSADKMRHERESSDSLRNFSNQYKGDDDRSVASKADSDTSWKLLNQVASIEEEKFRNAEAGRTGTTSPIGGRTSNTNHEQNKIVSMPTPSKMASLTSLSSVASEQEPLDTSNSKDELDLIQCASSGSLLFNTNDDSFTKRPREERGDAEEEPRGGGDDEIRRPPSSSPPNVASLSMQEKDAARPPKKRRGPNTDDYYDNAPSYSFSLESATSFSRDQQFGSLPALTEKPRQSSFLAPFGNQKEKSDTNRCDMLASSNLLWDIKGQDSFGGALSVGSNISGNGGDGPVITSSFSFGKESNADPEIKEDPTDNDSVSKLPEYGRTISENHSTDFGNIKCENTDDAPRGSRSDSIDVNRNPDPNARAQMGQFPHQSSNWINNAASFNREQPDAHHGQRHPSSHPPGLYAPNQNGPSRSFSSTSLPPQRIHPGQKHAHDMMRNYSQDSGQSNPSAPGQMPPMSRYGPLHGPYGVPLPPHIPQSDAHLPPSFRPPHPPMQSHGHMNRQPPPQAVYVMSTPPGGRPGMNRHTSADESVMSKAAGGVYSWTKQDDARLTEIMKKFKNPKDWEPIAKEFGRGKSPKECHERWIRYLKPGVRKGQWQDHEDAIVVEAVTTSKEQPFTRWSDLAQRLPGRVGKQIRDRWVNHLNPNINHMPFTRDDDLLLWDGHKKLGKRWVEISSKYFNSSRSENHIKNRWYSASFKKFIASEFGPDAYHGGKKKETKGMNKSSTKV